MNLSYFALPNVDTRIQIFFVKLAAVQILYLSNANFANSDPIPGKNSRTGVQSEIVV